MFPVVSPSAPTRGLFGVMRDLLGLFGTFGPRTFALPVGASPPRDPDGADVSAEG